MWQIVSSAEGYTQLWLRQSQPGLGRKDEMGDIAGAVETFAVETFKVKAAEKAALEADGALRRQKAEVEVRAEAAKERAALAKSKRELLGQGLKSLVCRRLDLPPDRALFPEIESVMLNATVK
jgi:hypothetical protein